MTQETYMSGADLTTVLFFLLGVFAVFAYLFRGKRVHGAQATSVHFAGQGDPNVVRKALAEAPKPQACMHCVHFDKTELQATMQRHPAFVQAARVLSPAEMAYPRVKDAETGEIVGIEAPRAALKLRWEDFGACAVHNEGRHETDVCARFEAKP